MELGASAITLNNEKSPRGISINFDEFGKPLKDLIKSHERDEIPKILTDIITYINYFEPKKPYFCTHESNNLETQKNTSQNANSLQNILLQFLQKLPQPLITIDVTKVLIRIQEKYGSEHPYLCNSRFRHALHQLPQDAHAVLHHLFHFLNSLCSKDINSDSDHSDSEGATINISTCQQLGDVFVEYIFGNDWKTQEGHLMAEDYVLETQRLLSRILSEFISEYRAIFEIESTIEHIVLEEREAIDADFHEHRKRHDGYDECPEDIKAMKIACDELSLQCTGSREASPAKLSKKHDCLEKNDGFSFTLVARENKKSADPTDKNSEKPTVTKPFGHNLSEGIKTENRNRIDFVKTFVHTATLNNNNALTIANKLPSQTVNSFSEVPNTAESCEIDCCAMMGSIKNKTTAGCICPRKRKERQDSTSEQDRKFSRSSSLEFPVADCKVKWRSASVAPSVEDSARGDHVLHEVQECADGLLKLGDNQDDRIEVFNRPRKKVSRNFKRKNRKERCDSLKENEQNGKEFQAKDEKSSSLQDEAVKLEKNSTSSSQIKRFSSPPELAVHNFKLSYMSQPVESKPCWVSQQLQHVMRVDTAKETMSLNNEIPQTFNMINSERHLEHNQHLIERRLSEPLSPKRSKEKQLSRQLSSVRKKIEQLEQSFKQRSGYRPSQADKLNDPDLKKMITEQDRIKKEIKTQKENSDVKESLSRKSTSTYNKCIVAIKEFLLNMEQKLEENRTIKMRPFDLEIMSLDQIFDEKLAIQTVLLEFEKIHGHPETTEEKDAMKELYERYRSVKRLARRSSSARSRESATDLTPIPEEEAISLTLASPGHRIILSVPTCQSLNSNHLGDDVDDVHVSRHDMDLPDIEHVNREDEHWHSMSRLELVEIQRRVREEKKQLKRTVKEFEDTFKTKTGRKLQKEDRQPFEKTYQLYKTTKSKLKLIDALLSKQL